MQEQLHKSVAISRVLLKFEWTHADGERNAVCSVGFFLQIDAVLERSPHGVLGEIILVSFGCYGPELHVVVELTIFDEKISSVALKKWNQAGGGILLFNKRSSKVLHISDRIVDRF